MAQPTTRETFKDYCLRKLGKPVIEINVDQDQVEDRIDEALSFYYDYHYDGTQNLFHLHEVTQADKDNGYIQIPENIIGIYDIFDIGDSLSTNNLFSIRYQFALNEIYDLSNYNLSNYYLAMQHIQFLEEILVGKQPIRYNRHVNKLWIDMNWDKIDTGNYICAKVWAVVDPNEYPDVWKDRWLQNYATAKIKLQWGDNLSKFSDMQLPGGIRYNGDKIVQDAREEIRELEEDMIFRFSLPATDLIG